MAQSVGLNILAQFPQEVGNFSSQYGSDSSLSYTAINLTGKTNIYPSYGDFTQAFVLRTYGEWWFQVPSSSLSFKRAVPLTRSQDFIELWFDEKVYPTDVYIYETYIPGSVIRILACDTSRGKDIQTGEMRWEILWSGIPEVPPAEARVLSPPIKSISFKTNLIRIEFNHRHLQYYSELDAVLLLGTVEPLKQLVKKSSVTDITDVFHNLSIKRSPSSSISLGDLTSSNAGYFDFLPAEVIQSIVTYLDLPSMCSLAQTCRLLKKHCYDPLQYIELDLKSYWHKIFDSSLDGLQTRCSQLQRFNLSWCGTHGQLSSDCVERFFRSTGRELTCLLLASCRFINSSGLKIVAETCSNLQELDLQSCRQIEPIGFLFLIQLRQLKKLNLYRTLIDMHSMIVILRSCTSLEHLNLGACFCIVNFDDIAVEIGKNLKSLKSLDLWRAKTLSFSGLHSISENCTDLMEIDLGWCVELASSTGCFVELIQNCHKLRKLFLTAIRTVCDADLLAIANHCLLLEQLDILGTREISQEAVFRILCQCKNLKFLDISFCGQIEFSLFHEWQSQFPHVSIKKSFQG